jgi:subtilisin family serine protease
MFRKLLVVSVALIIPILNGSIYSPSIQRVKAKVENHGDASQVKFRPSVNAVSGKYVVTLANTVSRNQIASTANELASEYGGQVEYVYTDVIKGFAVKDMNESSAKELSRNALVGSVEEAARAVLTGQQSTPAEFTVVKSLDRIDQRNGFDGNYTYPRTGTGVHVYVVDTGVWIRHNDFGGRASALFDFQPQTSAGGYGTGAANDNHGTLSASYIGSKNFGVAKNCLLHSVRVTNFAGTEGTTNDFIAGLQQILNDVTNKNNRPAVVNISLGFFVQNVGFGLPISPSQVTSVENAVSSLINNGITVVAGAGNFNANASTFTPARMSQVLTVGGSYGIPGASEDSRAIYFGGQASNFGTAVDVYAPSGGVLSGQSWFVRGDASNTDYGIEGEFGTSAAAPHAAGAAALYLEQFSLDPFNAAAQPAQVEFQIKNNASVTSLPILYMGCQFIAPPASNPIDNSRIFIRQQYYDFLSRQPDQGGWDFWTGTIDQCNGDPNCIHVKRVNGSKAFFESIEFQGTGYFVYRVNKISFSQFTGGNGFTGPNPRMEDFFTDQRTVGNGVVVLAPGWEQLLEQNKLNYAQEWVNRPRFLSEYPLSMSNDAFVDKLYQTAQISDPTTRNAMVSGLNNGTETRATVVKKIAESSAVANSPQFFNGAYVLMQYFGYLRRNPDDAPDGNLSGYNFWLGQLNSGTKTTFDMVDAFISSGEYRDRFFASPFCN